MSQMQKTAAIIAGMSNAATKKLLGLDSVLPKQALPAQLVSDHGFLTDVGENHYPPLAIIAFTQMT